MKPGKVQVVRNCVLQTVIVCGLFLEFAGAQTRVSAQLGYSSFDLTGLREAMEGGRKNYVMQGIPLEAQRSFPANVQARVVVANFLEPFWTGMGVSRMTTLWFAGYEDNAGRVILKSKIEAIQVFAEISLETILKDGIYSFITFRPGVMSNAVTINEEVRYWEYPAEGGQAEFSQKTAALSFECSVGSRFDVLEYIQGSCEIGYRYATDSHTDFLLKGAAYSVDMSGFVVSIGISASL